MKKIKTPSIVIIGVITLITIVLWVVFGVLRIVITQPSPDIPDEILSPITPTLDTSTISELENRTHLSESEIGQNIITPQSPTPVPIPENVLQELVQETPTASPSPATSEAQVSP